MQGIAFDKGHAQLFRQAAGDGGLARAGHAHHHDQGLLNALSSSVDTESPALAAPPWPRTGRFFVGGIL